jgi:hypothetical protein
LESACSNTDFGIIGCSGDGRYVVKKFGDDDRFDADGISSMTTHEGEEDGDGEGD